jgi:MFS family permease
VTVALASAGVVPVALDSAVNIAFPAISAAFAAPVSAIQWVVIVYILTDACLLLPAGRLADRVGHRRIFGMGLGVTALALGLCGAAPTFAGLLGARGLQGVGAALVFATAPALVTLASPEGFRRRALGWYHLAFGAAITAGPLLGGVLVAVFGWRAVYLARLPLAVLALLLAWRYLPPIGAAGTERPAAAGGARVGDRVAFVVANATNLAANAALFFVWLLVPYYLVHARGLPVAVGGLLFAAGTLATAVGAPVGGWWADRGGGRWLVPAALGLEALGLALTAGLGPASSWAAIAGVLVLAGGGVGLFTVPNMYYVMSALPRWRQGWGGSLVVLMRMAGIVLGARLATWLYEARLAVHGAGALPEAEAAALAFRDAFLVAAGLAAAAALLSLWPPAPGRR